MWENSSAYSRVRFEDIAPITSIENIAPKYHKALNKPQHQQTSKTLKSVNTNFDKNANKVKPIKANYINTEKLILCLMETLQWLHLGVQPIFQVILLFEQKYL